MLHGARAGWLNQINGTVIEEHSISLGDHTGGEAIVEATLNDLAVKFKLRNYIVQHRYYQIMVAIPKDRTFTAEMDTFLQSFALLKDL